MTADLQLKKYTTVVQKVVLETWKTVLDYTVYIDKSGSYLHGDEILAVDCMADLHG